MTLSAASASLPDLLRLVAVPVFAWTAVRDIRTRRVSSSVWIPLSALAASLLAWDGWVAWNAGGFVWTHEFLLPAAISLGFVVPLAYLFWWFGGFGGADAKAMLVLALLFPTFPTYAVGSWNLPATITPVGAFSFTILTNAVLIGVTIPIVLAIRNAAAGRIAPVMFVGWPVQWEDVPETHGRLLRTPDGLGRGGLDLDALRMYLRWRGLTFEQVRENPIAVRDPATLPDEPNPPTDGAVTAGSVRSDGGSRSPAQTALETEGAADAGEAVAEPVDDTDYDDADYDHDYDDPWGAETFLADIDGSAYGTSPARLREGLDVLSVEETVWISPGMPFLVPVFVGLVIALVYGDLLLGALF